jgi:hypothetical protein
MITEVRRISGGRMVKEITFRSGSGEKNYLESVRMYTREELFELISGQGMTVARTFGDYSGSDWHKGSERTIIMARRSSGSGGE